jgi:hypothetical protein
MKSTQPEKNPEFEPEKREKPTLPKGMLRDRQSSGVARKPIPEPRRRVGFLISFIRRVAPFRKYLIRLANLLIPLLASLAGGGAADPGDWQGSV